MKRLNAWAIRIAIGLFLAGVSTIASSLPNVGLSMTVNAGTACTPGSGFSIANQPGPSLSHPITVSDACGTAIETGTVQFGSIVGSVSATGNTNVGADFFGVWEDWLQVTSATLAFGAPVDLLFTMNYNFSTTCSGGGNVQALAAFNPGPGPQMLVSTTQCNGLVGSQTFDLLTTVGAILTLEGQIHIDAASGLSGSALVDPPVGFFIDPLTAGVSFITGSGTDYSTPVSTVPEPATLALLALGLFGVALTRRRSH